MNTMKFNDIVKGRFGRKTAYTNVEKVDESNIVKVVAKAIGTFYFNRAAIKYLWDYKNGDQPIRYRTKTVRDDILNVVVENHAWEIVRFKNGQTYGEPVQLVGATKDDKKNEAVELLNRYMTAAHKHVSDISSGEWTSAVGTGYKAVQIKHGADIPFRIVAPTPLDTFIIYQKSTNEPMVAVQELKDENDKRYFLCFTDTHEYRIQNSSLLVLDRLQDGTPVYSRLHAFRGIPIVEFPNNQDRISDIELVIDMLDAINNMQSNRMDSIEQFVQSWIKFVNCEVDPDAFRMMKEMGALVVKSNNGTDNKADVDIMSQELNQTESQVAKNDLLNNILSIEAIPNKEGNTGGDTQGAVELRNGWDFSKQAARLKDAYIKLGETRLCEIILNVLRTEKGAKECPINAMDYDVQIIHSPTDNMQVKAQVFNILVASGIHPLIAIKTCGLWSDAEKTYIMSKPYLDNLYKTIDMAVAEIPDAAEQEKRAKAIADGVMNGQNA